MRQTTEHVRRTTAERGLEKVALATSSWAPRPLHRPRPPGTLWLGMRWLHPRLRGVGLRTGCSQPP
ncbi:hypothetical protein [Streptomyces sp. NRRL S-237]|uniref:hypothetical protein n=1 Tax=Streptomyces sp. NRRL S-237 TaxID=1463895 RepID=UPI0004CBB73D|nr:hypothetical protein [Streptomyces sp. NRRL S-237]